MKELKICPDRVRMAQGSGDMLAVVDAEFFECPDGCSGPTTEIVKLFGLKLWGVEVCSMETESLCSGVSDDVNHTSIAPVDTDITRPLI